jgi:hypothetical protein
MGCHIKMNLQETGWEMHGLDLSDLKYGQVADSCEFSNEIAGFIKYGEFIYYMRTC